MRSKLAMLNVGVLLSGVVAVVFAVTQGGKINAASPVGDRMVSQLAKNTRPIGKDYGKEIRPILENYCFDCHGDGAAKGGLSLDEWKDEHELMTDRRVWNEVARHLETKVMPPATKDQPTEEERQAILGWIENSVFYVDCENPDPGRVTIRRLNRQEYNNTIRDLVGVNFEPAADFPPDDTGYGFDNIGDVLSISPVLLEKYLAAAENVMDQAIRTKKPSPLTVRYNADRLKGGGNGGGARILSTVGRVSVKHRVPSDGEYVIRVMAGAHQAGGEAAQMKVLADTELAKVFEVANRPEEAKVFEHRVRLKGGDQELGVDFLNDFYDASEENPDRRDRNLLVNWIEISGPSEYKGPPLPKFHREWLPEDPKKVDRVAVARATIEKFASRAFRRPVTADEVERLLELAKKGAAGGGDYAFEEGMKLSMVAVLVSPNFLFRNELQPEPNNPEAMYKINEFALASRLSYFLWSSMPDAELFQQARANTLRKNWDAQVARMLADPKSRALTENFAGQWLQLRDLALVDPDRARFKDFDEDLRKAMRRETEMFFEDIVKRDADLLEFLRADYTFANERLAKHYGIEGVKGKEFRKVSLDGTQRGGVLTHASILTLTSNPTRTSPVKRGKWILDNILGTPPPHAPPNIPPLENETDQNGTLRERLEQHRADPNCAACHALMDPIGLAFENFDAIGRWRTEDDGGKIDPSGVLESGDAVRDSVGLRQILVDKQSKQFTEAISRAMLTYALGRGLEFYDRCAVEKVVEQVESGDHRFSSLVLAITRSVPFQMRRGDGERE